MEIFTMKTMRKSLIFFYVLCCFCLSGVSTASAADVGYQFKPPQNNFFIKYQRGSDTYFCGYINGEVWEHTAGHPDPVFLTSKGKRYEYVDNKWRIDSESFDSPEDVRGWIDEAAASPPLLSEYYANFWERYNNAVGGNLNPKPYHLGKERFLGIDCGIFKDNMANRYWIDPSNGCTLKIVDSNGKTVMEALEYNLNFTAWPVAVPSGK
jgi:hypothetical protein